MNYRFVASRPVNFVLSSFVSSVIYCEPLRDKAVDISFVRKNVTRDRVVQLVVAHNLITNNRTTAALNNRQQVVVFSPQKRERTDLSASLSFSTPANHSLKWLS